VNNYQKRAANFEDPNRPIRDTLLHGALGLCGEAGEVAELIEKDAFQGRPFTREALKLELGDVLWHIASIATACGFTLDEIGEANIAKLTARYPHGFELGGGVR
jgi:NTP pyrophosphatase (non-canonical NTP hydrolase)